MKKAIINQMFLGFLLLSGLVTYVATLNDEQLAKKKVYNLQDITTESMKALGNSYFRGMSGNIINGQPTTAVLAMCQAEDLADGLLQATSLGQELLDSGSVSYVWRDSTNNQLPDSVTVTIEEQTADTFWYKLLGKDTFTIPRFGSAVNLATFNFNVDVNFRGVIQAGYYNMVGTYEEDEQGCPTNAELILANKDAWHHRIGDKLATIEMPQTKMFFIADGYRRFGNYNNGSNTTISLDTPISFDCSEEYPTAVLTDSNGQVQRSDEGDVTDEDLTSRANVYFQDTSLNFDKKVIDGEEQKTEHMNEIAEKDWGAFVAYMEEEGKWNDEADEYADNLSESEKTALAGLSGDYNGWLAYAQLKGIDFTYDPNGEYVFVSEDLAATTDTSDSDLKHDEWGSDNDFSDMSFSMRKIFIPEPVDLSLISDDQEILLNCDN